MKILNVPFTHVAHVNHIDELNAAIRTDGINLAYAPLDIAPLAETYINNLDLSPDGEFSHIVNPNGHDPSIGSWKSLFFTDFVTDPKRLEPKIIHARMTELPDRHGKEAFATLFSNIAKAYWPARSMEQGMEASLMLKYPATNPKFHLDDSTNRRGLVTLRGDTQKGATKILANDAVNIWQRQANGYPFLNPIGEAGIDFTVEEHQMMHLPLRCMSIHEGVQCQIRPGLLIHQDEKTGLCEIDMEILGMDMMAEQNPLAHSEPSAEECPEARLQIMLN